MTMKSTTPSDFMATSISTDATNDDDPKSTPQHISNDDDDDSNKISIQQQQQQQQYPPLNGNHHHHHTTNQPTNARIVYPSMVSECGERLRNGDLVAFPTETVYGLGCNALNEQAVLKVFHAKERPLTDPLISHVADPQTAYQLWHATATATATSNSQTTKSSSSSSSSSSLEARAIHALTQRFWPGPLTLVAKAVDHVPSIVMAGTGFCACRSPSHPLAIRLIRAAQVPIAAPSANKFGHVSPTTAQHVWDDLLYENVWILKDNEDPEESGPTIATTKTAEISCEIGVESSVAKIEMINSRQGQITLLRQGAVSVSEIAECLHMAGLTDDTFTVISNTKKATDETVSNVAPGQTIRHYSPNVPSYMISRALFSFQNNNLDQQQVQSRLSTAVVIDFGGLLQEWQSHCLEYQDLSPTRHSGEATQRVFQVLRWAEQVENATSIFFPEIDTIDGDDDDDDDDDTTSTDDALTLALKDRLTRAASGVVLNSLDF
ncbi:Sua5/YciO/YrdC/YwlC family protein [Nitzschia inconspicua]|uniref:Sua5/YciO/YrdC/YwlC family protein n=1 Tax=Nitzschia inconspicua TaxID=303405 RepID=A0A9K3PBC1_9STRA|nr:Sua5/YciO/YrdC/YwlC family protein [Nitzschia inconspicua]